ncbi:S8 family serine peptidase [Fictibacillus barbaricus]|uniref:S8 family serine peptidase n=1 Tax=Fictibacillus barbaricus TaxID=182136 RepID=A0ABS2ZBM0_9BACL|nr:S8 family serine peptidase [Fictibacillus barbaricus]MBN3544130.1 S8 family serine peptidase [Fictibacillus barbaricus]GGB69163.1 hypothetical protein GCM10007199_39210 [Fictibacillus barbaricus]
MNKRKKRFLISSLSSSLLLSTLVLPNSIFYENRNAKAEASKETFTKVIVEMEEAPAIKTLSKGELLGASSENLSNKLKTTTTQLKHARDKVLTSMDDEGIKFTKSHDYSLIFNGMSVKVPKDQLDEIRSIPGVKAVYPDQPVHGNVSESVPLIGAPDVWSKHDSKDQNVTGKGVTVAIIDSGIDYRHPDLGGKFGPEHKVVAGYDYVNDDEDPMDDSSHGTHVAGIVAANGKIKGVAPDASLTAYKVLDDANRGELSDVIAAIEASIQPDNPYRADIINLSLSNTVVEDPSNPKNPLTVAAQNAVDAGIVVVASAGNSNDYTKVGSPAVAKGVIAVGASISGYKVPAAKMVAPFEMNLNPIRLDISANAYEAETTRELVDVGEGNPEDFEGLDVKGKLVLIKPPKDQFEQWTPRYAGLIAEEKGAYGALVLQHTAPPVDPGPGDGPGPVYQLSEAVPSHYRSVQDELLNNQQHSLTSSYFVDRFEKLVAMEIDAETGEELKSLLTEGPVKIKVTAKDETDTLWQDTISHGDLLSMKPDIVAPGYSIYSTYLTSTKDGNDSGYNRLSGTSMAAPHVAGAAALLKQLQPNWEPKEISAALKGTAKPLDVYDLNTQGAGRLDVHAASRTDVIASPDSLNFGLVGNKSSVIDESDTFSLKNHSKKPVDLDFTVKELKNNGAKIIVSPSKVHIEPGMQATIDVKITMDQSKQDTDISGWIEGTVQSTEEVSNVRVPFKLLTRHLQVTVSPDPASSDTEAFIYSPVDLETTPQVTVRTPNGETKQVQAVLDHDRWWRAPIQKDEPGIYQIEATSTIKSSSSETDKTIIGSGHLEILPVDTDQRDSSWQPIGPNASAAWLKIDKNNRKSMTGLSLHTSSVFKTMNGAESWQEMRNLPVGAGFPIEMVVDPTDEKNIYVPITSDQDPTYIGKIVASQDGGKTWKTLPFPNVPLSGLEIDESGGRLVAISNNAVYVSQDRGMNWKQLPEYWKSLFEARLINGDLYVTGVHGVAVYKRIFAGSTTAEQVFTPPFPHKAVSDVVGNKDILIANVMGAGMYASYNQGIDWIELEHSGKPFYGVSRVEILEGKIYAGTHEDGILVSHDNGRNWSYWKAPLPGSNSLEVDFTVKDRSVFVSSVQAGIYETKNSGKTYKRMGIPAATVYDLAITNGTRGHLLIAGTESNTYQKVLPTQEKVTASTREWGPAEGEGRTGEQVHHLATSPSNPKIVYKTRIDHNFNSFLYRSSDGGKTWDVKLEWIPPILDLQVHPADTNQIFLSYYDSYNKLKGIMISNDGGDNWKKITHDYPFLALVGDPIDSHKIWAGGSNGLFVSENRGESFKKVHNVPVSSLAFSPNNPNSLVIGGQQLFVSNDGGKTIQESKFNQELGIYVNDIKFSPRDSKVVYAATGAFYERGLLKGGRGVLRSSDGGKTWENISQGLNNRNATALEISPDGEYLFVGTEGGSVHRIKLNK